MRAAAAILTAVVGASAASPAARFRAEWRGGRAGAPAAAAARPLPAHCGLAVVGAGWGGVYFAWRAAVDSGAVAAAGDVCVFEANGRVGGRVFSVHGLPGLEDLALDVGGYRFIEDDKLPAQLVSDALRLPTTCYDYSCQAACHNGSGVCHIMRDPYGNNAGYALPVETMLGQVENGGGRVFFGAELDGVFPGGGGGDVTLRFAGNRTVRAGRVLLNLPHNALERLDRRSVLFTNAPGSTAEAIDAINVTFKNKVYLHYEDAWWNTKLGLMEGLFQDANATPPLAGRYHDGPQKCVVGQDTAGRPIYSGNKVPFGNCSGVLEIYYDGHGTPYYRGLMADPLAPLAVIDAAHANASFLSVAHAALMEYHAAAFRNATARRPIDPSTIAAPVLAVIANWIPEGAFTPGIGHPPCYVSSHCPGSASTGGPPDCIPCTIPAAPERPVRAPVAEYNVYIANQDYGPKHGWAVSSLIMAEKVLQAELGVARPTWLDAEWYAANVVAWR